MKNKKILLSLPSRDSLEVFLKTESEINIKQILKLAYQLLKKYDTNVFMGSYANNLPLKIGENSEYESF